MKKQFDIGDYVIVYNIRKTGIMDGVIAIGSHGKVVEITSHGIYIVDINGNHFCFDYDNLTSY